MNRRYLAPEVTAEEALAQLERIKLSAPFRSSRRCVLFLDYVVHLAVKGDPDAPKERTIGVDVFGRDPDYDTNQDPIVRGTASEIRKRLAQYYQLPEHDDELRIDLSAGSYVPQIHPPASPIATAVVPLAAPAPPPLVPDVLPASETPRRSARLWVWVVAAAAALGALAAGGLYWNHSGAGTSHAASTALDQFWAPTLSSSRPVLLCVGQPTVYNVIGPLSESVAKAWKRNAPAHLREGRVLAELRDIVPSSDRYLAIGDAICIADMAALFARRGRDYRVRGGSVTSFADLRENTTVLIGGFTNDWAMRLAGPLRFRFAALPDGNTHYVQDRQNPNDRRWSLKDIWPAWDMPVDYAIVSRVLDSTTKTVVVMAAGITQYGTAAAGEFLTNPEYLGQAFDRVDSGWQRKNLQVVLATKVIGSTAGPPEVLAVSIQ